MVKEIKLAHCLRSWLRRLALESKSQRIASRVADIASGAISADTTQGQYDNMNNQYLAYRRQQVALGQQAVDGATWQANEEAQGRAVDDTTVVENIAQNVLDKDKDFVTQSGAEVNELVQHIDQGRIDRMAANKTLFGYGDVAEGVENTIKGMASEGYMRNGTSSNEFYVRHEEDALRIGKTTITIPPNILTGAPSSTFEGYAVPAGFNNGVAVTPVKDSTTGHYIYRDASDPNGRRGWDATVGRYIDISGLGI